MSNKDKYCFLKILENLYDDRTETLVFRKNQLVFGSAVVNWQSDPYNVYFDLFFPNSPNICCKTIPMQRHKVIRPANFVDIWEQKRANKES